MKSLIYTVALCLLIVVAAKAQTKTSCCVKPAADAAETTEATIKFAMLGNDESFREKHENPLPFTLENKKGKTITYKTPDGKTATAYEIKAPKKTDEYLFVFHEWWGLNDYIRKEAERFAQELGNVNVIALDLYDGKVATEREKAAEYMQAVKTDRAKAIINGAIAYAGKDADIATVGWCFGGAWSLQAGILAGDKAEAIVMYYGMPEQNVENLKKLDAPVLGIFASQDNSITPQVVEEFKQNMDKADRKLTVKMYDAVHAFANPSNPKYNKEYAEEAHKLAVDFIKKHLD
ncbi:dienelactone hydrolase family protein [Pontibacter cellulosilyticus]|uniref:Dienelactone hydrolase family protein n=1 Tax=Pontibacter cellulosilyticus TaxID=1720253 RepID=A0A923SNQ3_9BACT|nr:dienelactone hydrolase family protein [Pontibacter cellulosilyticus]MBC5993415.1 dienelactone hydrolase family protein [Pontibacter cellulosilyticus]